MMAILANCVGQGMAAGLLSSRRNTYPGFAGGWDMESVSVQDQRSRTCSAVPYSSLPTGT